jgi:hypothetical protein
MFDEMTETWRCHSEHQLLLLRLSDRCKADTSLLETPAPAVLPDDAERIIVIAGTGTDTAVIIYLDGMVTIDG